MYRFRWCVYTSKIYYISCCYLIWVPNMYWIRVLYFYWRKWILMSWLRIQFLVAHYSSKQLAVPWLWIRVKILINYIWPLLIHARLARQILIHSASFKLHHLSFSFNSILRNNLINLVSLLSQFPNYVK